MAVRGSVMVSVGIGGGGKTDLVFIHGNMTAQRYCDKIITHVVIPFLQQHPCFLFQQRPTARLTTNIFERKHIKMLNWPPSPKSPDLSSIEHAWAVGYAKTILISMRHDLQIALNREWNAIIVPEINAHLET